MVTRRGDSAGPVNLLAQLALMAQALSLSSIDCRLLGGTDPGAPQGNQNARKHCKYSAHTKAAIRFLQRIAHIVRTPD